LPIQWVHQLPWILKPQGNNSENFPGGFLLSWKKELRMFGWKENSKSQVKSQTSILFDFLFFDFSKLMLHTFRLEPCSTPVLPRVAEMGVPHYGLFIMENPQNPIKVHG